MPLAAGASKEVFVHNLKTELAAGKELKQALAIAYAKQRGDEAIVTEPNGGVPVGMRRKAKDKKNSDWSGLIRGLIKFFTEEERESEHMEDMADEHSDRGWAELGAPPTPLHPAAKDVSGRLRSQPAATGDDSFVAARLAFDRASARSYDIDGRLHVELTPITRAVVNDYYGREIPGCAELGLTPDRKYALLRDPEELKKAAPSFNNLPLMRRHVAVSAAEPKKDDIIGSLGTDAVFRDGTLWNSLVIWSKPDIDAVERGEKSDLSASYRYRADMTPGVFEGKNYDGRMVDMTANHVTICKDGRVEGALVADSAVGFENVGDKERSEMTATANPAVSRRFNALKAFFAPRLAKDQTIDGLDAILALDAEADAPMVDKKAKDAEEAEAKKEEEKKAADKKAKDEEESKTEAAKEEKAAEDRRKARDARRKSRDEAPEGLKAMLKGKLGAEDYKVVCDMIDAERKADDEEEPVDPEKTNDRRAKDKKAMDSAQVEATVFAAVKAERGRQAAIYEARNFVKPWVGELPMAFDSSDDVYAMALKARGVKLDKNVHPSAFKAILTAQPKLGASQRTTMAHDAVSKDAKPFAQRFPGADKIRIGV